jgi:acylphosphatase
MKSIRIRTHGKVQGVYFRQSTLEVARSLSLRGWVRNEADGTVLIHAEGREEALQQLVSWCHRGPSRAVVNKVDVTIVSSGNFVSFEITATDRHP